MRKKIIIATIILSVIVGGVYLCRGLYRIYRDRKGLQLVAQGNEYMLKGDLLNASKAFESALNYTEYPAEEVVSKYTLGILYSRLGEFLKAINTLEGIIRADPLTLRLAGVDRGIVLAMIGNAYSDLGQYRESLSYYEVAINLPEIEQSDTGYYFQRSDPTEEGEMIKAFYNLGSIYRSLGYNEEALSCLRQVIYLNPDELSNNAAAVFKKVYPRGLQVMGMANAELGRKAGAKDFLTRAVEEYYKLGEVTSAIEAENALHQLQ